MMSRIAFPLLALMVAGGCSGSDATDPMSHDMRVRQGVTPSLSESFPRSGDFLATKDCSHNTLLPGGFCTITSSNVKEVEVGTKVVYAQAPGPNGLDSDVILDPPGQGNSIAFGHCKLNPATKIGLCTFSGGTGQFTWFDASVVVTSLGNRQWAWTGTYSFSPHD